MLKDIAVVMVVAGDEIYFKFASCFSVPSFLRNNLTTDLFIFTDNVDKMSKALIEEYDRLHIVDYTPLLEQHKDIVEKLERKGWQPDLIHSFKEKHGYTHKNVLVTALNPIAESFFKEDERYSHILKIDSDTYHAGGDMMELLREEVKRASPDVDLFLVERTHDLMTHYGGGQPGSGFTLWRKGGRFIDEYSKRFDISAKTTIIKMKKQQSINIKMLSRPGFHFCAPFNRARDTGRIFTKEMASRFLPAYFHLNIRVDKEGLEKMEEWFGEEKNK